MTLEGIVLESALYKLMSLIFVRALRLPHTDAKVYSLALPPEYPPHKDSAPGNSHGIADPRLTRIEAQFRRHSLVNDVGVAGEADLLSSGGGEASRGVETSSGQDGHGGWAV